MSKVDIKIEEKGKREKQKKTTVRGKDGGRKEGRKEEDTYDTWMP